MVGSERSASWFITMCHTFRASFWNASTLSLPSGRFHLNLCKSTTVNRQLKPRGESQTVPIAHRHPRLEIKYPEGVLAYSPGLADIEGLPRVEQIKRGVP